MCVLCTHISVYLCSNAREPLTASDVPYRKVHPPLTICLRLQTIQYLRLLTSGVSLKYECLFLCRLVFYLGGGRFTAVLSMRKTSTSKSNGESRNTFTRTTCNRVGISYACNIICKLLTPDSVYVVATRSKPLFNILYSTGQQLLPPEKCL